MLAGSRFDLLQSVTNTNLTQREIEIIGWSALGKTSSEVAIIEGISERTVNFHLANVMEKLGAVNKTAAVAKAVRLGLI